MTQSRADEIVRKVIYAKFNVMPKMKDSEEAFHVGRMMGQMQRQLEIELSLEVEPHESEDKDTPKLVIYSGDGYADGYMVYDYAECPNCGREFEEDRDEWEMPFCCACGQALKWEE